MNDHLPPGRPKAERGGYTVLWLQSGGCGGCSMSLLCADTTDFQGHLSGAGIDLLWHPSLSLASGTDVIALLQSVLDGHTRWTRCASRARCCAAPTAPGGSTCWRAPACP
jgi:hypothetical protein